MHISSISDLLAKYKKQLDAHDVEYDDIAAIISEVLRVTVSKEHCALSRGVLTIKGSMVLKNELHMRKDEVIGVLRSRGHTSVIEVR